MTINPAYKSDRVTLYHGDSLEVLPYIGERSVDAVITDPPYSSGGQYRGDRAMTTVSKYVQSSALTAEHRMEFSGDNRDQRSFLAWCSLWLTACAYAARPGAVLCCFSDWRQVPVMTDAIQAGGWTWRNLCTWWKPGCRMQKGRFSASAEFILYATNGPHDSDGEKSPQNVIRCATMSGTQKEHIAKKPAHVVAWAISVSKPAAVVLDPFMGSGSTGKACLQTGRTFIGIEKDERYIEMAIRRLESEEAQGRLFDE